MMRAFVGIFLVVAPAVARADAPEAPNRFIATDAYDVTVNMVCADSAGGDKVHHKGNGTAHVEVEARTHDDATYKGTFTGDFDLDDEAAYNHIDSHSVGKGPPSHAAKVTLRVHAAAKNYRLELAGAGTKTTMTVTMPTGTQTLPFDEPEAMSFKIIDEPLPDSGDEIAGSKTIPKVCRPAASSSGVRFDLFVTYSVKPAKKVTCGPDITTALIETVGKTRSAFASWTPDQRKTACNWIASPAAAVNWDIIGLHVMNDWIAGSRPECDSEGGSPSCSPTVEVKGQCFYAGSVNYVIWGVMFRLCADTIPGGIWNEDVMKDFIWGHKGIRPTLSDEFPDGNWGASQLWATAGYQGWPAGWTPPGDRQNCACTCPKDKATGFPDDGKGGFKVIWEPMNHLLNWW
jgi:hypothetical protein